MLNTNALDKRLRFAGVCVALGLLVEALCLLWATPIAFVIFVGIGGLLIFIGIVVYLYSLASTFSVPE